MENKNNNKRTYRLGILLLVFTLLSTVLLPGTFAKYTSQYAGSDTALVAKWDVTVKEGDKILTAGADNTLNLFDHAYETNIKQKDGDDYIIAPGVEGEFTLVVNNASDVAAKISYELKKTKGSAPVPMDFSIDGGKTWVKFEKLNDALNGSENIAGVGSETETTVVKTVKWKWAFDGGDANDTELGLASTTSPRTNYGLNVKVTATQVKPETNEDL